MYKHQSILQLLHLVRKGVISLFRAKRRLGRGLIALTLLASLATSLIVFPSPSAHATLSTPTTQQDCLTAGGTWTYVSGGGNNPFTCNIPLVKLMTPMEEASSMTYYADLGPAVGHCVTNQMWPTIDSTASEDGHTDPSKWYNNNNANYSVYPSGSLQSCADITKEALQLWGWGTDYKSFLSGAGYHYDTNQAKWFEIDPSNGSYSTDGTVRWNSFSAPILSKVYGGSFSGTPLGMSKAAQYVYYLDAFTNQQGNQACQAQDLGLYGSMTNTTYYDYVTNGKTFSSPQDQAISGLFPSNASGEVKFQKIAVINPDTNLIEDHGFAYETHNGCDQVASYVGNDAPGWVEWINTHPNSGVQVPYKTGGTNPPGQKSTCALNGVGWIVCPVAGFIASITDGLFSILQNFLITAPLVSNSPVYNIWASVRNLANVMFVIGFMVIIFSQLSGVGLTNYNIKKMLPRIIIAAILVNISYWVCALAVDLSNVVGVSLRGLIENALTDANKYNLDTFSSITGWLLSGGLIATGVVVSSSLILGAGGWVAALALLLPVMISAFFAILTVVFVLAARQAIIILLVVLSPLAFVAFLLPNTESLFTKWRKLFVTMLVIFPMISLLFGATKAAATIIRGTTTDPLIYIFSLAIQIIPLFLTPFLVKMGGSIFSRISGMVNNQNRGPIDRLRKRAEAFGKYKASDARAQNLAVTGKRSRLGFVAYSRRRAERDAVYNSAETRAQEAGVEYMGRQLRPTASGDPENQKLAQRMAGSNDEAAIQRFMSRGAASVEEIEMKDLKAGHVLINNAQLDGTALTKLFEGKDVMGMNGTMVKATKQTQMAAADLMMSQGRQMDMVTQKLATSGDSDLRKFAVTLMQKNYSKAKEKQIGLTDEGLMRKIADGKLANDIDFQAAFNQASAEKMVGATVTVMSTQEKSSLLATQKGIGYITRPEDAAKIRETAAKVIITPSAVEKTNKDTYKAIQELSASINTQMPGQGTLF